MEAVRDSSGENKCSPPPREKKGQKDLMDEWSPCGLMGRGLFDFLLGRGCSVSRALRGNTFELLCDDWHGSVISIKPPPKWGRGQSKPKKHIGGPELGLKQPRSEYCLVLVLNCASIPLSWPCTVQNWFGIPVHWFSRLSTWFSSCLVFGTGPDLFMLFSISSPVNIYSY